MTERLQSRAPGRQKDAGRVEAAGDGTFASLAGFGELLGPFGGGSTAPVCVGMLMCFRLQAAVWKFLWRDWTSRRRIAREQAYGAFLQAARETQKIRWECQSEAKNRPRFTAAALSHRTMFFTAEGRTKAPKANNVGLDIAAGGA